MSEWYEQPYKGGPMVKVKGFPRPMYPPSAKSDGKTPSKNGPDVVGYKRTVSRAGRWPWQPFDEEYSDAFARGKGDGWDPATSGVRGVQRQSTTISPTSGWIGKSTFNLLRSIRIPEGLPHAGEMAMDATAIDLINEAWEMFGGKEPAGGGAKPGKLTRKWMPSPNWSSRGGSGVRLIVLHTAEGATTIESLGNFFASSSAEASSHVGIDDKDGVIGEYVKRGNKAWTAANANPVAVQAELCAFAKWSKDTWMNHPNMLRNCARWIAEESDAYGIPITKLNDSQAQGSGRGVCQHENLGSWGGGHWDCGTGFPMDHVLEMARSM